MILYIRLCNLSKMMCVYIYIYTYDYIISYKYSMGFGDVSPVSQCWQLPDPPEKTQILTDFADSQEHVLRSAGQDHEHVKARCLVSGKSHFVVRRTWRDGSVKTKMLRFDLLSLR